MMNLNHIACKNKGNFKFKIISYCYFVLLKLKLKLKMFMLEISAWDYSDFGIKGLIGDSYEDVL